MRDAEIRQKLDCVLRNRYANDPNTLIRHETGLCAGKRRIDIAVINHEIAGYEVKSDVDTLYRLIGQAGDYEQVLDRITLVTTDKHLEHATSILPSWWGVMVANQETETITIKTIREPAVNTHIDPFATAQMLWHSEALEELRKRGLGKYMSKKARYYLWTALAESVPLPELRAIVLERILSRHDWWLANLPKEESST